MTRESLALGIGTALVGIFGLVQREWLLAQTPKGRLLVESLGQPRARRLHVTICLIISIFGALLATGLLTPIRW